VAAQAVDIAQHQQENQDFVSLPQPGAPLSKVTTHYPATAAMEPAQRAEQIIGVVGKAERENVTASGAYACEEEEVAIGNSLGIRAYQLATKADLSMVMMSDQGGTGFAQGISDDVEKIDADSLAEEAVSTCVQSANPQELAPGEYPVYLGPQAVGTLMMFLAYLGLGAQAYREKRSFLSGKLGEQITGSNITIWDDGLDAAGLPMPFDFEGVAKKKVMLIENGVARNVVYDSFEANLARTQSTGHAIPAGNTFGPVPMNLFLQPGDASSEEIIRSIKRGIYITRFHYTNVVEPMSTTITGMTRDGTFLIEDGNISHPVKNLRFTQNILEALGKASLISKTTKAVEGLVGVTVVPSLKIDTFRFSSTTQF
jgi:predicted Zn-dependent protease